MGAMILPGDRVFISEDRLVAFDTRLGKIIAPIERVLGAVLLGTSTAQQIQFYRETAVGLGLGGVGGF